MRMANRRQYETQFLLGAKVQSTFGKSFKTAQRNLGNLNKQANMSNKAFGGLNKTMKAVAGIAGGYIGFRAVTGFLKSSTQAFMNYEASMSEVKAVTGETGERFQELSELALDLGKKTSKTASEAAQAIKYMGLAGWDTTKIMGGLEPVLRLSEAANLDLGRTSDLATDSMSSLGLEVNQLPKYLDQLAQTSRRSNTNIDMLMEAMIAAGGTFRNLKTPLSEANSLIGILANRGKKGSEAGNALNSIIVNLTTGAGKAGTAMKKLNLSAFNSNGKFKGISNVLVELNSRLSTMTEKQRNTYLAMIGGKTQLDTLNALLDGVSKEYGELKNTVENADGALEDMALTMQDNFKGSITRLKSAVEGFQIEFMKNFGPVLRPVVERLSKSIINLTPSINKAIKHTSKFRPVAKKVVKAIKNIKRGVLDFRRSIQPALGRIKESWKRLSDWLESFKDRNHELVNEWKNNMKVFKEKGEEAFKAIGILLDGFSKWWDAHGDTIVSILSDICRLFGEIVGLGWDVAVGAIESIGKALAGDWKGAFHALEKATGKTFDNLQNIADIFKENKFLSGALNTYMPGFQGLLEGPKTYEDMQREAERAKQQGTIMDFIKNPNRDWFKFIVMGEVDKYVDGSHATGLKHVPKNGYIAELHKGERVLTKKEAEGYNKAMEISEVVQCVKQKLESVKIPRLPEVSQYIRQKLIPTDIAGPTDLTQGIKPENRVERFLNGLSENRKEGDIVFAPTYSIQGNADKEVIKEVNCLSFNEFKEYMRRYKQQQKRISFAGAGE